MPFFKPETMHEVAVVVQPAEAGEDVTTYVTPDTDDADQLIVMDALPEIAVAVAGAAGDVPSTTVVTVPGPVPPALFPETEMLYVSPFVRPLNVHVEPPTMLQLAPPGVAVAT